MMIFYGILQDLPSGNLLHSYVERSTIFDRKTMETHYFDWAIFNGYVTNYQRVTITRLNLRPLLVGIAFVRGG